MKNVITRRLEFDAAHRILGHEGKCANLHGHRYAAEISVSAGLDSIGRVIDYGVIKERIGSWIDKYWDHNILLHKDDLLLEVFNKSKDHDKSKSYYDITKIPYVMSCNPTAENIARELYAKCNQLFNIDEQILTMEQVRIYETPNCWADWTREYQEEIA